ncbi:hypothetical protein LUZ62_041654 [Rhynchospora pubera]|uniref:mannan endo-1,4-beta-mannosidase n=1 Tax=Rhynchospora pubera TaxID=906938 RepID=A0AAV8FAX1_9POAL|nr:hypothetical protein LUZ62_041654 [Rhynchospora pubera]
MTNNKFGTVIVFILGTLNLLAADDSFVRIQSTQFTMDGHPFLFNGFNSYWLMNMAAGSEQDRTKVVDVFSEASANGLTVCRTWAFADGGDRALQLSPGVYDEHVFQALDYVISEAKNHGIRLILSLVNNFKDFGGRAQYVKWAQQAGEAVNSKDDFYTNELVKQYYRNHIKRVLTRINSITQMAYKDDPTIMAWELINEPRCASDPSGRTVHAWVQEMANYTKSIDEKHLLEVGMEGFYGNSNQYNPPGFNQIGTDYIRTNLIKEIDFATIHAYPDLWLSGKSEEFQKGFVQQWTWNHLRAAKKILQKPLVFTEFGKSRKDPGFTETNRDTFLETIYDTIYNLARSSNGSLAGGLIWQLFAEGMDSYSDGYDIVLTQAQSIVNIISNHSYAMSELANAVN